MSMVRFFLMQTIKRPPPVPSNRKASPTTSSLAETPVAGLSRDAAEGDDLPALPLAVLPIEALEVGLDNDEAGDLPAPRRPVPPPLVVSTEEPFDGVEASVDFEADVESTAVLSSPPDALALELPLPVDLQEFGADDEPRTNVLQRPFVLKANSAVAGADGTEVVVMPLTAPGVPGAAAALGPGASPGWSPTANAAPKPAAHSPSKADDTPSRGRWRWWVGVGVPVVLLVGGAAMVWTPWGVFGRYALERYLPSAGDAATVQAVVKDATHLVNSDTFAATQQALQRLGKARRSAGLSRSLLAASLLVERWSAARFGAQPRHLARIATLQARLDERSVKDPAPIASIATALEGESRLSQGKAALALKSFQTSLRQGGGALAHWGMARAALALVQSGAPMKALAAEATEATLKASPAHVGARLGKAILVWADGDEAAARRWAEEAAGVVPVKGGALRGSALERAAAWVLLGQLHEFRQRYRMASEAYAKAQVVGAAMPEPLLGAARILLEERRYQEALARFETVAQSVTAPSRAAKTGALVAAAVKPSGMPAWASAILVQRGVVDGRPPALQAQLGVIQAKVELESLDDARALLQTLAQQQPKNAEVRYWTAVVDRAQGQVVAAEQNFRLAMQLDASLVDAYLGLAGFLRDAGRRAEADGVVEQAKTVIVETAAKWRKLGADDLQRGDAAAAVTAYEKALAIDGTDLQANFGLAVALRRAGRLAEAARQLDALEAREPTLNGLALERGRLFERQGDTTRALASYEAALKESTDDADLWLRVAAVQVMLGRLPEAAKVLAKIPQQKAASAEAEYLFGRVAFANGQWKEAEVRFRRAVQLDPSYGPFRLYEAWVALELGDLGHALKSASAALAHPDSQVDAHWILGKVHSRTGAVQDALREFHKALELAPQRVDIYAQIADCYEQSGQRREALRAYETALAKEPNRGEWWFALGRLQLDNERRVEAKNALLRSIQLASTSTPAPPWLADAHRAYGDLCRFSRKHAEAAEHYRHYLKLAPTDAADRKDVERLVAELTASN